MSALEHFSRKCQTETEKITRQTDKIKHGGGERRKKRRRNDKGEKDMQPRKQNSRGVYVEGVERIFCFIGVRIIQYISVARVGRMETDADNTIRERKRRKKKEK
ncbi:hypothetical protein CDAR_600161 [Caerostris darwini]|uniref:Uncharacterized protein n=1 Tax=Caerostris darwini TaxID=1538125 RepID=A0AAV4RYP4_9ARAC|nr:hypothetical protein CDAR_600161 [Caerostris darwini]